tara:strand:- start:66 stop:890 length:825 start_codon:yes stop_codon:yes gene_type:complete
MRIAICTWYNDGASYGKISNEINKYWANTQGYDIDVIGSSKSYEYTMGKKPHWNRLPMLDEYLNKMENGVYYYDYVMWLDADACFRVNNSDMNVLERILDKYSDKDFIFSEDKNEYIKYNNLLIIMICLIIVMYILIHYNKIDVPTYITIIIYLSLFILTVCCLMIKKYKYDYCLNSGVIIIKNTEYSRKILKFWLSEECYVNRVKPWQDQGCLRYSMYKNVNDIRQHSVTEKLGVLQKFYYKPDDTSLIVHFAGSKSNQRTDLFNNLKQEWSI